ncbi:MAG: tRNA 2-thiouridine(34) synthase MnmA [Clostridia bacterium]|nr:tRNA 2-thiouridine(34) synthase MnmA [Clostridia bacterium]
MEKVLLGMSGGIDSTFACRALQEKGYEVEGLFLSLHKNASSDDAKEAAKRLGIKLHVADYSALFEREVEEYFISEYLKGRTPNPCVVCNRRIKFYTLLCEANKLGIHYVATGHYVRIGKSGERYFLKSAADSKKDQSYFLWQLTQEQLSRFLTPLAELEKRHVIEEVRNSNLVDKTEESQEICFVPDDDYVKYLKERLNEKEKEQAFAKGNFVLKDGRKVGEHNGIASYTVGQRKGLGVALGRPAFVIEIKPDSKEVVLGFETDNISDTVKVSSINFVGLAPFVGELDCFVRPRYRSPLIPCTVSVENGEAIAKTHTPIKMPSPGQSAVFYNSLGEVLFGGYIELSFGKK